MNYFILHLNIMAITIQKVKIDHFMLLEQFIILLPLLYLSNVQQILLII